MCVEGHSNACIWRFTYRIEAEEESLKGGDMMTQCPHFFLLLYPLQQPLMYLNQPKMLVVSEGHLVVFGLNIHVYRMNRLLGVRRERAGWLGCNAPDFVRFAPLSNPGLDTVLVYPRFYSVRP